MRRVRTNRFTELYCCSKPQNGVSSWLPARKVHAQEIVCGVQLREELGHGHQSRARPMSG